MEGRYETRLHKGTIELMALSRCLNVPLRTIYKDLEALTTSSRTSGYDLEEYINALKEYYTEEKNSIGR